MLARLTKYNGRATRENEKEILSGAVAQLNSLDLSRVYKKRIIWWALKTNNVSMKSRPTPEEIAGFLGVEYTHICDYFPKNKARLKGGKIDYR